MNIFYYNCICSQNIWRWRKTNRYQLWSSGIASEILNNKTTNRISMNFKFHIYIYIYFIEQHCIDLHPFINLIYTQIKVPDRIDTSATSISTRCVQQRIHLLFLLSFIYIHNDKSHGQSGKFVSLNIIQIQSASTTSEHHFQTRLHDQNGYFAWRQNVNANLIRGISSRFRTSLRNSTRPRFPTLYIYNSRFTLPTPLILFLTLERVASSPDVSRVARVCN